MLTTLILFAQEEGKKGASDGLGGLLNPMYLPLILIALFFFVVILPNQRRQRKEQENLLAGMKKNDEVQTAAGIIGVIWSIKENADEVTLKIDDNARIRVLKSSIVRILKKEESKDAAPATANGAANTNIKPT